ncbi:MAG: AAA family ATPase [Prevotellaceae bacterium]|jgi:DNA repair exonuclease SbcCD ATPase subunit|nr:AAA family ATPase [Prevotellaceae bacterium]
MKKVTLKSITLKNFKGTKKRTINFSDTTTISGKNATGKTTIWDAWTWLLFGKDSQDRTDYQIKRLVAGKSLAKVDCEVSAILDVSGEQISLRRVFVENWVKPHGQIDEVFKGNTHELFWNDVPLKVAEYRDRINNLVDVTVFKMITSPSYFASMEWKLQREELFQLAGNVSDAEIVSKNPDFAALLDVISGKSLSDFKIEIAARKKKLKVELGQIQPRIDQTTKLSPEAADFAAIENEIAALDVTIKDIDKSIVDKTSVAQKHLEKTLEKQNELNELKIKTQNIVFNAKQKAQKDFFDANTKRKDIENKISEVNRNIGSNKKTHEITSQNILVAKQDIAKSNVKIKTLRNEWVTENAKEYKGDDLCPSCGQLLPEELRATARQLFADAKANKLKSIENQAKTINEFIAAKNDEIEKYQTSIAGYIEQQEKYESELGELNAALSNTPIVEQKEINPNNIALYVVLNSEIKVIEEFLTKKKELPDTFELKVKKDFAVTKRDSLKQILRDRQTIADYKAEIVNLETKGRDLAQQIADIERKEFTIQSFLKTKIEECEKRINGLFSHITFKLFDYTIEGNEVETCVALVGENKVPFPAANKAGQVNAGIDIINALTKFYGVSAPIFIDNSESINEIINTESQVIHLVVTNEKLRIN